MSTPTTVVSTSRRGRSREMGRSRAPDLTPAQAQRNPSPPHYAVLGIPPTWVRQPNGQMGPPVPIPYVIMRRYRDSLRTCVPD